MGLKRRLYLELAPEARRAGLSVTNAVIVGLVVTSFLLLALETEPALRSAPFWATVFQVFNFCVVIIFAVEYLARLWAAGIDQRFAGVSGRVRFAVQFYSLADLFAFLPELILLLVGSDTSLIVLLILRLARLVRIARFVPAFDVLGAVISRASSMLYTSLILAAVLVYVSAVILYFVEGIGGMQQAAFASIPRSIWWAVATLTTVGYGDVYPVTPLGRFCAGIIAIAGIGVVALPAGIFASAFSDELRERELARLKSRLEEHEKQGGSEDGI